MTRLVVIGATGDVGRGVVREASARGWTTFAASRSADVGLFADLSGVQTIAADASSPEGLSGLLALCSPETLAAVVVATNPAAAAGPVLDLDPSAFTATVTDTLLPHLGALGAFLPRLRAGALFLGLGGGMADLVVRGYGPISAAQAAQRALYRNTAKETRTDVAVHELMIRSMVAGDSNRHRAPEQWLSDSEVGRAVCDLVVGHDDMKSDPVIDLAPRA